MLTRRHTLTLAAAGLAASLSLPAFAQDWKAKYPELVFAVVPAENASGVTERYAPFAAYLTKELGVKVTVRVANDYAAVIEGQRAGNIHLGEYGPSSYIRAWTVSNGGVEPFATLRAFDAIDQVDVIFGRHPAQRDVIALAATGDIDEHAVGVALAAVEHGHAGQAREGFGNVHIGGALDRLGQLFPGVYRCNTLSGTHQPPCHWRDVARPHARPPTSYQLFSCPNFDARRFGQHASEECSSNPSKDDSQP